MQSSLKHLLKSATLLDLVDYITAGLNDKLPVIKLQCAAFLEKTIPTTYIDEIEDIQN